MQDYPNSGGEKRDILKGLQATHEDSKDGGGTTVDSEATAPCYSLSLFKSLNFTLWPFQVKIALSRVGPETTF